MKKCYASPEMGFEEFRVNRSVAACAPRGQGGFDENANSVTVRCEQSDWYVVISRPHTDTVNVFASASTCVKKLTESDLQNESNTVSWGEYDVWYGTYSHSGTLSNPTVNGLATYFYS